MSPEERASRANSVDGLMQTFPQTMKLESRIASEIRHAIQKSRRQAFREAIEICDRYADYNNVENIPRELAIVIRRLMEKP